MSRVLDRPVRIFAARAGRPSAFRWNGRWHRIAEVLDTWVYREPWWQRTIWGDGPSEAPERTFFRVRTSEGGMFELTLDAAGAGRLYRVFD